MPSEEHTGRKGRDRRGSCALPNRSSLNPDSMNMKKNLARAPRAHDSQGLAAVNLSHPSFNSSSFFNSRSSFCSRSFFNDGVRCASTRRLAPALLFFLLLWTCVAEGFATEGNLLVSVNMKGDDSGNAAAQDEAVSADGRYVAFTSEASNLVSNDTNFQQDVFVRDLRNGVTVLASVNAAGTASANGRSSRPYLSADGRYVAFDSNAADLVPGDTNGLFDVFIRDMQTQQTTRVSLGGLGGAGQSNDDSYVAAMSADGRFVAFVSNATNIVPAQTGGFFQLYVHDMQTGETKLASINGAGTGGSGDDITAGALSADGHFMLFESASNDLVAGTNALGTNIYARDLQTNATKLVNVNMAGNLSDYGYSTHPRISANGRYVVFESTASDLVADDSNVATDIFIRDLQTDTTRLVSVNAAGTDSSNLISFGADISADGRYVTFVSSSTDLTSLTDNNRAFDVFMRDMQTNTTKLVSVSVNGAGNAASPPDGLRLPRISADGRFVLFISAASDLAPNDTNGHADLFLRDTQADSTRLLSMNYAGTASGNADSGGLKPQISADGQAVAYESFASDLVARDTNFNRDIFAWMASEPPASIQFSSTNVIPPLAEGETAKLTITRTINTNTTVTVDYSTKDGTAKANVNYEPTSGTLAFLPGETSKTIPVKTIGDHIYRGHTSLSFFLDLTGTSSNAVLGAFKEFGLQVVDTDSAPMMVVENTSVGEGPQGTTTEALFKVRLLSASALEVSVDYRTTDDSAMPGSDYVEKTGQLVFQPGETEKLLPVTVIGDNVYEGDEKFILYISHPVNAYIAEGVGYCTILDDDQARLMFTSPIYEGSENVNTPYVITVTREGDQSLPLSVDYATTDGTASQRTDYFVNAGTLTFAPGEMSKTFNVMLQDDLYVEPDESFSLMLSNPTRGAVLGSPSVAIFVIHENDTSAPTTNPLDDSQFFVRQQYLDFLNRPPDAGGLAYWTNEIAKCGANLQCIHDRRVGVADAFSFEAEFQQTGGYIYRIYRAAIGLRPTYAQFINDRSRIVSGPGLDQSKSDYALYFARTAAFRQEYADANTAAQFVDRMLTVVKNYSGVDISSQRASLVDLYDGTDNGRAAILRAVADNAAFIDAEYNRTFVLMEYFGYLRRDPDQGGYDFWLSQVNNFPLRNVGIQHAMACSFITSAEYQLRFSSVVTHTNQECPQ